MIQISESCRDPGSRALRSIAPLYLGLALTAALLAWLAAAAVKSGGLDRLLPEHQPFAPCFTT